MYSDPISHLPDPERQAVFYEGVTLKRALAWVVDVILVALIALPIALFTVVGLFILPLVFLAVGFLYRWITIGNGSATLGMRFMAIELRNSYGERLDSGQALLHTLGYYITMSTFILQVISVGFMATSERGQGLSDMVLGTTMLNRRV